jgi:hypothetical protein
MTARLFQRSALPHICMFGLAACSPAPAIDGPDAAEVAGTMQFVDVEGGCWGIALEHERVQPVGGLPPEFKKDGLAVYVQFEALSDFATTCQIGTPVKLKAIRKR